MDPHRPSVELVWSARHLRPAIVAQVLAVFVGFMAVAHFVFHSPDAVKALFLAAIGAVAALVPGVLTRTEYRLTEAGLARRTLRPKDPKAFKELFAWDELSHLTPTGTGFKFYKRLEEPSPFRRFLKQHVLAGHAGEFHVEPQDRGRVAAAIDLHGIPLSGPPGPPAVGPGSSP